jgi:signal-transduction protein with cAMP-binding, CBS, and nucleotidyltransferase domain
MAHLLSAYSGDITSWRAASDFVVAYRQALLAHIASEESADAEELFGAARTAVEAFAVENRSIQSRLNGVLEEVSLTDDLEWHKELTSVFFRELYRQLDLLHSAPAFYQGSMLFLRQISAALVRHSLSRLGSDAAYMPHIALTAVGPAGRCEYSPFCPLQIALIHAEATAGERETVARFGQILHSGFEALGLHIDPVVTPRNQEWCGTAAEWRQRGTAGVELMSEETLIDQLRLADLCQLYSSDGTAQELQSACTAQLRTNRPALESLIKRMEAIGHGLGLMGGLKLERSGPAHGMFPLLQYGLMPLSAAVSALALIKGSTAESTLDRVHDLLGRQLLDVDLAERIVSSWHTLHELRLFRERTFADRPYNSQVMYLNPKELQHNQREALKEALESVAVIQRQVGIAFAESEE